VRHEVFGPGSLLVRDIREHTVLIDGGFAIATDDDSAG
jgi:hypothetical protein